jgi:predicted nucleic acid-binding protein
VLLDILTQDPTWSPWSSEALAKASSESPLVVNPLIYAEVSLGFSSPEELERALPREIFFREALPFGAAFLAGRSYLVYRKRGGARSSPMPDFYIGAHAVISGYRLLTRDAARYRTYFPSVELIAPPYGDC